MLCCIVVIALHHCATLPGIEDGSRAPCKLLLVSNYGAYLIHFSTMRIDVERRYTIVVFVDVASALKLSLSSSIRVHIVQQGSFSDYRLCTITAITLKSFTSSQLLNEAVSENCCGVAPARQLASPMAGMQSLYPSQDSVVVKVPVFQSKVVQYPSTATRAASMPVQVANSTHWGPVASVEPEHF